MLGMHERTVRRLLKHGYPNAPWGKTPINAIVEQERAKARALRATMPGDTPTEADNLTPLEAEERARIEGVVGAATLKERTEARKDALEARTQEAAMVQTSRVNVITLAAAGLALVRPAQRIAEGIARHVENQLDMAAATGGSMDPAKGLALLKETAKILKDVVETGQKTMEMERLLLGDPSAGGKVLQDAENMSDEDMLVDLTNATKILGSLERKGLRLVQGGRGVVVPKGDAPAGAGEGSVFDASASRTTTTNGSSEIAPPAYEPPAKAGT